MVHGKERYGLNARTSRGRNHKKELEKAVLNKK